MNRLWLEHHKSLWIGTSDEPHFSPLSKDTYVDVAVIGGGISGLTAAYLLQKEGKSVAILEKDQIATGESGYTTAHLTVALDTPYHRLLAKYGDEETQSILASKVASIAKIEELSSQLSADVKFKRVPAYLYAEDMSGVETIEQEAIATLDLGMKTKLLRNTKIKTSLTDLPYPVEGALLYPDQAQFHPRRYLLALAEAFLKAGGKIFEFTHVKEIEDANSTNACRIATTRAELRADDVLVLTNSPISTRVAIHTKIAAYRTYAIAFKGNPLEGLYWDTMDPYHFIRAQQIDDQNYIIIGGEDHKTGQVTDTAHCFENLEHYARTRFGLKGDAEYRWSGQVIEPVDGLPYIGRSPGSEHIYLATGFSGNGMTFGTLSAMILKDYVLNIDNAWADIYDPARISPIAGAKDFLKENANVGACLIKDWIHNDVEFDPSELKAGDGGIFELDGKKVAAFKDGDGRVHLNSAVCPHLGCIVHWNNAESSFDCPCHGSRFNCKGEVLNGPARSNLEKVELPPREQERVRERTRLAPEPPL
jgi:glycine/D-amino acid oxidase-like deaminating enzyme/nitrite reductase/ring-hydroxylating ferredoxin subunit